MGNLSTARKDLLPISLNVARRTSPAIARAISNNPFAVTKAVDFSDSEIEANWVDWPDPGGFADFMNVNSPMPRIIKGGKGTGRTHIMRHFSAPVQAIRSRGEFDSAITKDGVLGIYALCSGLNSSRFRGRGVDSDAWQAVFAQYADIWLAQAALSAFRIASSNERPAPLTQKLIVDHVIALMNQTPSNPIATLDELANHLLDAQRRIDRAVSHAALAQELPRDFSLFSVRGNLVFGIPRAIQLHHGPFQSIGFLYLVDEFENFTEQQQQYVNSLLREKRERVSFMIGVRTFGLRTLETLNAVEENKRGSEFDEIELDRNYIGPKQKSYRSFCASVVAQRLFNHGLLQQSPVGVSRARPIQLLRELFATSDQASEESEISRRYPSSRRPYMRRLRRKLQRFADEHPGDLGVSGNVDRIIESVKVPERPMLEKINTWLLYRAWYQRKNLNEIAQQILESRECPDSAGRINPNEAQQKILSHFITDLRAQLRSDMRRGPVYAGIDQFIDMSDGLPRNLLVILKNVYRWAVFNGERPFDGEPISLKSQALGVRETAEWFFADATPMGREGVEIRESIHRLGEIFRRMRYSDKPVECSLNTFSADLRRCTEGARHTIDVASKRSMIVPISLGQKERNTGIIESKFQLNRLLAPLWGLPTARRGAIGFSPEELNAIFDPAEAANFNTILRRRTDRMNAPFPRRGGDRSQPQLPMLLP